MLLPSSLLPLCSLLQTKKFLLLGFSSVYQVWLLSAPIRSMAPSPTALPVSCLFPLVFHPPSQHFWLFVPAALWRCAAGTQLSLSLYLFSFKSFHFLGGESWNIWSHIDRRQEDRREKKVLQENAIIKHNHVFLQKETYKYQERLHSIMTDCWLNHLYRIKDFPS